MKNGADDHDGRASEDSPLASKDVANPNRAHSSTKATQVVSSDGDTLVSTVLLVVREAGSYSIRCDATSFVVLCIRRAGDASCVATPLVWINFRKVLAKGAHLEQTTCDTLIVTKETLGVVSQWLAYTHLVVEELTGSPSRFSVGAVGRNYDVNAVIDALAQDQLISILAEPNLTAQSGETASFLAGGEFPIPVAATLTGQITIEFKQFGVSLSFVPTVLGSDRLSIVIW